MKFPDTSLESSLIQSGFDHVVGVDEVGMGCLAGPVVVCAVSFNASFYKEQGGTFLGLNDSKLLSANRREEFAKKLIREKNINYSISISSPKKIDEINIYQASRVAMRRAIEKTIKSKNSSSKLNSRVMVLVDGNKKISDLNFDQQAIVKGDQKVFAIACASIIAKVYRDKLMDRYAKDFPAYGFEQHKGYSTKIHQEKLNELGPCPIHRRSFRLSY